MFTMRRSVIILVAMLCTIFFAASSCDGSDDASQQEQNNKAKGVNSLIEKQPAHIMTYSPTRNTIDTWGKQWEKPGALAYTYITDGPNDTKGGYYVFIGPPVSYCVALTNPDKEYVLSGDNPDLLGPAPGIDGAYGGGDCSLFYGIDAVTHTVVSFSVGMGQNLTYFQQPNLRYKDARPLGTATVQSAKGN